MRLFKLILALSLIANSASAAQPEIRPALPPVPQTWVEWTCRRSGGSFCLAARGWHWYRKNAYMIDPGFEMSVVSGTAYSIGVVVRTVVGESPEVVLWLSVSRAGILAGTIVAIGGLIGMIIGVVTGFVSSFLAMTTSTQSPEQDRPPKPISPECLAQIAPFHQVGGLAKLRQLTPEQMTALIPCLEEDKPIVGFLEQMGHAAEGAENQLQPH